MLLVNNRFFFVQHLQSDIFQQAQCGIVHNFFQMRGENSSIGLIHSFNVFPYLTVHFILHSFQILFSFGIIVIRITKFVPNNQQNIHNHTNKKHNSQKQRNICSNPLSLINNSIAVTKIDAKRSNNDQSVQSWPQVIFIWSKNNYDKKLKKESSDGDCYSHD